MKVAMRPVHPMTDPRTVSILQPAAAVLAVTAASYGLSVPPRVLCWNAAPRTVREPGAVSADTRPCALRAHTPQGEPTEA